jgi:4-alpha-glucanotransferase
VLDAMGATPEGPGPAPNWVVRAGERVTLDDDAELELEDGGTLRVSGVLPPRLPLGYHRLHLRRSDRTVRLIVVPRRCPPAPRAWGVAVQLATLRSAGSWGIGDLADLATFARWARGLGAGFVMVGPLHAAAPGVPQEPSPYAPTTRRFRNPLYLRPPGPRPPGLPGPAEPVDRDAAWRAKLPALEAAHAAFEAAGDAAPGADQLAAWAAEVGPALDEFATWMAAAEGRAGDRRRQRLHAWLQWRLDADLAATAAEIGLVHDLPVGFAPGGADATAFGACVVEGFRIGAPPDLFNRAGQEWGLPPLDPWRLRAAGYAPFVTTLRANLRHAAGVRIDHVMGLFRQWWVPTGGDPAEGVYVRYPWRDLLGILALEAHRAGAFVVGEDLGTVEEQVRAELAAAGVCGFRLVWFEDDPPARWPEQALAAVTTHDLPTVAGVWTGADLDDQRAAGIDPDPAALAGLRDRLATWTGLEASAPPEEVVAAVHRLLATAPCRLRCATVEDLVLARRRPNLPGTTAPARPNWSIPLPMALEEIVSSPVVRRLAEALAGT